LTRRAGRTPSSSSRARLKTCWTSGRRRTRRKSKRGRGRKQKQQLPLSWWTTRKKTSGWGSLIRYRLPRP
ncbi:unnamed protein product, partial [Ectocarpus fasciculatus]